MTRKAAREIAVHIVYNLNFTDDAAQLLEERSNEEFYARMSREDEIYQSVPEGEELEYIYRVVNGVSEHLAELDEYIEKYALGWKFGRLPLITLSIMRVAIMEILYMQDIPNAAAISEAVEISKKYEPREITSFINGILGSFVRGEIDCF